MAVKKRPQPLVSLPHIGPTDPLVRDYVTDVGTLTVNYAQLERHIRELIETILGFEQRKIMILPVAFHQVHGQKGKRTLGRLIDELKTLGVDERLRMALGQANKDRISIIHLAITLIDETQQVDYPAIHRERLRLRRVLKGVRSAYTGLMQADHDIFELFLQGAEAKLGASHPALVPVRERLQQLRQLIAARLPLHPPP